MSSSRSTRCLDGPRRQWAARTALVLSALIAAFLASSCDASRPLDHVENSNIPEEVETVDVGGSTRSLLQSNVFRGDDRIVPFVVNGLPVPEGDFRWMASLRRTRNGRHFCGAALIHERFVVTAAHCIELGDERPDVHLGRRQRSEAQQPNSQVDVFTSASVTKHPQWDGDLRDGFDIALIELDRRARGYPILDIPDKPVDIDSWDGNLEIVGWGETESGTLADDLMFADVEVFDRKTCNKPNLFGPFIKDEMFCAGGKGRDSCVGDSGGPIFIPGNPDVLVGITSFGRVGGCGEEGTPAVYTLINPFIGWLREVTGLPTPSSPSPQPSPPPRNPPPSNPPPSNPPPSNPPPFNNGLRPSQPSSGGIPSWWRPDIMEIIDVGSQDDTCSRGGADWQPDNRATGCQHCNTYFVATTIASCIECCCESGASTRRWTYSGCPGVRQSEAQPQFNGWAPLPASGVNGNSWTGGWSQMDNQW
eukprot:CAMPEP_0117661780 /NCGR_PEP_ID=MMETSP0804-20121206/7716_1 /TAXON_ID=1074897 /ORGANISM="Tetraselmis astigmatica, Strain CCMP880" /LENGTH=476 /DNA_ID=CAMNT_0005468663 /DNA_START=290 /DNA_END=1717 /DNA_ORIENTATION=+